MLRYTYMSTHLPLLVFSCNCRFNIFISLISSTVLPADMSSSLDEGYVPDRSSSWLALCEETGPNSNLAFLVADKISSFFAFFDICSILTDDDSLWRLHGGAATCIFTGDVSVLDTTFSSSRTISSQVTSLLMMSSHN